MLPAWGLFTAVALGYIFSLVFVLQLQRFIQYLPYQLP